MYICQTKKAMDFIKDEILIRVSIKSIYTYVILASFDYSHVYLNVCAFVRQSLFRSLHDLLMLLAVDVQVYLSIFIIWFAHRWRALFETIEIIVKEIEAKIINYTEENNNNNLNRFIMSFFMSYTCTLHAYHKFLRLWRMDQLQIKTEKN